jgi:dienelactone hydrolase
MTISAIAIAILIAPSDLMRRQARAQTHCAELADQMKGLRSKRLRLQKNLEKAKEREKQSLLDQLKDLDVEICATQAESNECPKLSSPPMCHGMRECTDSEKKTPRPLTVAFPGPDGMTLHGYLYVPGASSKKYPAMIFNHGSEECPSAFKQLARLYVDHGFVFFVPHRHGQGLSKNAGPYFSDLAKALRNKEATVELHELYNKDVIAAVDWLKSQVFVDPERIAMSGGSYGGIQDLLTAEKDPGIRAYVPFTPGTQSWGNTLLKDRMIKAVQNEKAPMFVIQAEGDYSLAPITTLMPILAAKGNQEKWKVKLYPKFGCSNEDAHARFAGACDGIDIWDADVLAFLDKWMK